MSSSNVIVAFVFVSILVFFGWFFFSPAPMVGNAPVQPIQYSHKFHAGELDLDCRYCHTGVDQGKKAGVPPVETCMNCHSSVGLSKPEIKKIIKSYNDEVPIEWIRIHNLPDHVRFTHAPHIKALWDKKGPIKEACMACHGDVSSMEVVEQKESLNMGFCIDCHRDNVDKGAEITCGTCHY